MPQKQTHLKDLILKVTSRGAHTQHCGDSGRRGEVRLEKPQDGVKSKAWVETVAGGAPS